MTNRTSLGIGLALSAAMLWGTTGTSQHLAPAQLSPYWIGALRLAIAAAFFAALVAATEGRAALAAAPRPLRSRTLLAGLCIAAYNLAFFAGVRLTGVAVGTTIAIGSGPIFAGAMQAAFTRRAPAPAWWLGTACAVAGAAIVALARARMLRIDGAGIALCLAAGFSYAAYTLVAKSLSSHVSAARASLLVFGTAAILALPAAWALAPGGLVALAAAGGRGWLVVGYLGVVATGVAYLLFSHALRFISAATGVALAMAEPLTAFILAITVLGEPAGAAGTGGMALIMVGLALVVVGERRG